MFLEKSWSLYSWYLRMLSEPNKILYLKLLCLLLCSSRIVAIGNDLIMWKQVYKESSRRIFFYLFFWWGSRLWSNTLYNFKMLLFTVEYTKYFYSKPNHVTLLTKIIQIFWIKKNFKLEYLNTYNSRHWCQHVKRR